VRRRKEIALAFSRVSHTEVFIEGFLKYAEERNCKWSFVVPPEAHLVSIVNLRGWTGDGVVAALNTPQEARCARKFHLPIVNISGALAESPVPRSMVDNCRVGQLAAEHLLDRGFRHFAYYGTEGLAYSKQRLLGFRNALAQSGFEVQSLLAVSTFHLSGNVWLRQQRDLTAWLHELPTPCGLLAVSDDRARQLITACHELGLNVPEQVAVIGVDDQQIICDHCHPTISSIARDNIQEGYQAARLLDRLLQHRPVKAADQLIPPRGIVARESTATVAVGDERLREALEYFQANIEEPVSVEEMCKHIGFSRRWLEYAFRKALGESPFNYIRRTRLAHARRLLAEERDVKINRIARRTGYSSANQLAKAFRLEYGMSPRDYRKTLER
jgi:LacI family transcriptional regulator